MIYDGKINIKPWSEDRLSKPNNFRAFQKPGTEPVCSLAPSGLEDAGGAEGPQQSKSQGFPCGSGDFSSQIFSLVKNKLPHVTIKVCFSWNNNNNPQKLFKPHELHGSFFSIVNSGLVTKNCIWNLQIKKHKLYNVHVCTILFGSELSALIIIIIKKTHCKLNLL